MRSSTLSCIGFVSALFILASSGSAIGQSIVATPYEAAFEEARERAVPILFLCFEHWGDGETDEWRAIYTHSTLSQKTHMTVNVVLSSRDYGEKTEMVDGSPRKVCAKYGQATSLQLRENLELFFREFSGEDEPLELPLYLIVTPDKEVLSHDTQEFSPLGLAAALDKAIAKYPTGVPRETYHQAKKLIKTAKQELASSLLADASPRLLQARELVQGTVMSKVVHDLIQELELKGRTSVEKQRQRFEAGLQLEALIALDELKDALADVPSGKLAKKTLKGLLESEEGKPHKKEVQRIGSARKAFLKASSFENADDLKKALRGYRAVAKRYGGTSWGEKAAHKATLIKERLDRK